MGELPQFRWPEHHQLQRVRSKVAALAAFLVVRKMLEPWAAVGPEVPSSRDGL